MSIKGIFLQNFRVFKNEAEFEFAPITILTGANNAGKSSILKAFLLFKDNIGKLGFEKGIVNLNFEGNEHHLGNFETTINDSKNGLMQFAFPIGHSNFFGVFTYQLDKTNLKNGTLNEFRIFDLSDKSDLLILTLESYYIDYLKIKKQIDETIRINKYIAEENTKKLSPIFKNFGSRIDPPLTYDPDKLIFDFEFIDIKSKRKDIDVKDIEDKLIMREPGRNQFHPEYPPDVLWELYNDISLNYNINNGASIFISDLEKKNSIKLKETENGKLLCEETKKFLKNLFLQFEEQIQTFNHLSSTRGNQSRVFFNDNSEFSNLLLEFQRVGISKNQQKFLNKWLKEFNVITDKQKLVVKREGQSVNIPIVVDVKTGKEIRNLADFGFGISQFISILLNIVLIASRTKFLYIEEPEANLHPNFQSNLADMFVEANDKLKGFGITFVLETHSEYLIRKLQYLTANKDIDKEDSVIYYLFPPAESKQPRKINITDDGRLTKDFGTGFVDEATKIIFDIWDLRGLN